MQRGARHMQSLPCSTNPPAGHTGTPVTPLQAPDDKLLHSAYCKVDGEV